MEVECYTCGMTFKKQPHAVTAHNFCGRACWAKWRSSEEWSGPNNPSWLGGNQQYRGPNWNRQGESARERDGDTCQECGKVAPRLPVHHKWPFHLFDDYQSANDLSNLVTLCTACHSAADNAFWLTYPEMIQSRRFPNCAPSQTCRECKNTFQPRSPRAVVCDNCCNTTCLTCLTSFYSRRAVHRDVKYCSKECRNAAIKRNALVCVGCGVEYMPQRAGTRYCSRECHLTHNNPRRKSSLVT